MCLRYATFLLLVSLVCLLPVAMQAQDTTATPEPSFETYTVRQGDTLLSIGRAFNVSANLIAQANNLTNTNVITIGTVLQIPLPADLVPLPPTTSYIVQQGDSLARIAERFNTTSAELLRINRLTNPNLLRVGQELLVPTVEGEATVEPTQTTEIIATATLLPTDIPTVAPTLEATNVATLEATSIIEATPVIETTEVAQTTFGRGIEVFLSGQALPEILDEVRELDVSWVKLTVNWRDVELTPGNLNLDVYDRAISALNGEGRSVMLTLTTAPDWARPSATEFVLSLSQYGPPDDPSTFGTFAALIAERYKGQVQAYEIWSEPNLRRSWLESTTSTREDARLSSVSYIELLSIASAAIRDVDPSAKIISAGLAPTGLTSVQNSISDRVFLRDMLQKGVLYLVDGIGVEPDGFANPPDSICCELKDGISTHYEQSEFYFLNTLYDYRALIDETGGNITPLWVTRFGWGTSEGNTLVTPNMDENPFLTYTDQAEQAQYTLRAFELGEELGYVGPMFVYNLNGCVVSLSEACFYSLLTTDGTPREVGALLGLQP